MDGKLQKPDDAFSGYHPAVNLAWFTAVLAYSMIWMHPVTLGTSLVCAVAYAARLTGGKSVGTGLRYLLPLMLLTAVMNPLFNHEGATILRWLPGGNPLTLEAILYGIAAAVMLVTVIEWFVCFNRVIESDKLVYLFGRIIPALSLALSMTLRFVPRFTAQMKRVAEAQKGAGRGGGSVLKRARSGLTALSITVTWALENAIETSDSMKSRGYGQPGRSAFSIYRFDRRDGRALGFVLFCAAYLLTGGILGGLRWQYYPVTAGELTAGYTVSLYLVWLALCAAPLYLSAREDRKWKYLMSAT